MGTTSDAARGNRNRCKPHHPKSLVEQARVLWDQTGLRGTELGRRVGLSRAAVCALARRNGFAERQLPSVTEKTERARKLWVGGATAAEISRQIDMNFKAIYAMVARNHFPPHRPGRRRPK